ERKHSTSRGASPGIAAPVSQPRGEPTPEGEQARIQGWRAHSRSSSSRETRGRRPASRRAPHRGFLGPSGPGLRGRDHGVGDSEPASHGHAVALTGPAAARWLRKERTLLAEYLQAGDSSGRIREAHEHFRAYATGRASLGDATVALDI